MAGIIDETTATIEIAVQIDDDPYKHTRDTKPLELDSFRERTSHQNTVEVPVTLIIDNYNDFLLQILDIPFNKPYRIANLAYSVKYTNLAYAQQLIKEIPLKLIEVYEKHKQYFDYLSSYAHVESSNQNVSVIFKELTVRHLKQFRNIFLPSIEG